MEQNRALRKEALKRGITFREGISRERFERPVEGLPPAVRPTFPPLPVRTTRVERDRLGRTHTRNLKTGRFVKKR
jgi:hypothetical protein